MSLTYEARLQLYRVRASGYVNGPANKQIYVKSIREYSIAVSSVFCFNFCNTHTLFTFVMHICLLVPQVSLWSHNDDHYNYHYNYHYHYHCHYHYHYPALSACHYQIGE